MTFWAGQQISQGQTVRHLTSGQPAISLNLVVGWIRIARGEQENIIKNITPTARKMGGQWRQLLAWAS
jgi:hypothetical protein